VLTVVEKGPWATQSASNSTERKQLLRSQEDPSDHRDTTISFNSPVDLRTTSRAAAKDSNTITLIGTTNQSVIMPYLRSKNRKLTKRSSPTVRPSIAPLTVPS
jgi:hypothetical protein